MDRPTGRGERRCGVLVLLMVICLLWTPSVHLAQACETKDITIIQKLCYTGHTEFINELERKPVKNYKNLCKKFYEFLECVARDIKECFNMAVMAHKRFEKPPYRCQSSDEYIRRLQKLLLNGQITSTQKSWTKEAPTIIYQPHTDQKQKNPPYNVEKETNGSVCLCNLLTLLITVSIAAIATCLQMSGVL